MSGGEFNVNDRNRKVNVKPSIEGDGISLTISQNEKVLQTNLTTSEAIYLAHLLLDVTIDVADKA